MAALLRHKRKVDGSDFVTEELNDGSSSPWSKKARQDISSTNHSNEFSSNVSGYVTGPELELPEFVSNGVGIEPVTAPDIGVSEEPSEPALLVPLNDERAIVLYKPVLPPLFPGSSRAGSQLFLDARGLPAGVLNASNVLRRREDELAWLSKPESQSSFVESLEEEGTHPDLIHYNHLAVVPWDPNSPVNVLTSQAAVHPPNANVGGMFGDDQTSGVEAMDEDNDSDINFVTSHSSNSTTSFCYEPWQQYGASQPQFGSLMWSH